MTIAKRYGTVGLMLVALSVLLFLLSIVAFASI